jgi:hypothetical protein
VYDPVNVFGKSGSSPLDNILDPGGWWGINKEGAMGQPDLSGAAGPSSLPNLGISPQYYDPNSFVKRPGGGGIYNNMAAQLAGPMYDPRLLPMAKKGTGTQGPVRGPLNAGGNGGGTVGYGGGVGGSYPSLAALLQGMGSNNTMPVRGVR